MYSDTFDYGTYNGEGVTLPYRIHMPLCRDVNGKCPAVLFLHGSGERGNDNVMQLKIGLDVAMSYEESPLYDAMIIAPQCAIDHQWVSADWTLGNYRMEENPETPEIKSAVKLFLEKCKSCNCDMSRCYVMGISMGGFGTWDCLSRYPQIFAAGYPCCGAGDPAMASVLKNIPIYTFHGTIDDTVPVEGTREMVREIEKAGGTQIRYKEYPDLNHWSWDRAYGEKEEIADMFRKRKKI